MMDVDSFTGANVWRGDSIWSSDFEVGKGSKKQKLSSFEVASKTYKRGKEHFVSICHGSALHEQVL